MGIWMEEIYLDGGLHRTRSKYIGLTAAADGSLDRTKEQLDQDTYRDGDGGKVSRLLLLLLLKRESKTGCISSLSCCDSFRDGWIVCAPLLFWNWFSVITVIELGFGLFPVIVEIYLSSQGCFLLGSCQSFLWRALGLLDIQA